MSQNDHTILPDGSMVTGKRRTKPLARCVHCGYLHGGKVTVACPACRAVQQKMAELRKAGVCVPFDRLEQSAATLLLLDDYTRLVRP